MSNGNRQRLHRDILEDLESEGKTLEVVLLAWSIVEMHSTNVLVRSYGLSTQNSESRGVIKLPVTEKLRRLREMGLLSKDDFNILQQFKEERNDLFHMGGLFFPNYSEEQKSRLTDMAIVAADVTHDMAEQALSLPSPYVQSNGRSGPKGL